MSHSQIFFVDKIEEISVCESKYIYFTGSSFERPKDFKRIKNEKHYFDTCNSCKTNYQIILKRLESRFKIFPYCCSSHEKVTKETWFNKEDFKNTPKLAADKIFWTWDFIQKFIDEPNWEEEITDYLDHVISSYGNFPLDHGEPLFLGTYFSVVKELLGRLKDKKYEQKKNILKDYLKSYYSKNKKNKSTDLNLLLGIYDKWYNTFPFEISIFQNLKYKFSKEIPIFERTHYNKYSENYISIPRTKKNLINFLCRVTDDIVININSLKLYENGKLTDIENYKLEIILQKRKLKLKTGYQNDKKDPDSRYRKIIKDWFLDEVEFIQELELALKRIEIKKSNLFLDILYASSKMLENKVFWNADENTRTKQILDLLEVSYNTKDQSQIGVSATGKKAGSVDGIIIDHIKQEYIIEALNVTYLNKTYIQDHIEKLERNYDSRGVRVKFLILYCELATISLRAYFEKYIKYINEEVCFQNAKTHTEILEPRYTNQQILMSVHVCEGVELRIYHILLKMPLIKYGNEV